MKNSIKSYFNNKYKLVQLLGIIITLPYVLVSLNYAPPTLFWFTTFPGWTLFFISIVLEYISYERSRNEDSSGDNK